MNPYSAMRKQRAVEITVSCVIATAEVAGAAIALGMAVAAAGAEAGLNPAADFAVVMASARIRQMHLHIRRLLDANLL